MFCTFIDDLIKLINEANSGRKIGACCTVIFLYADDIILQSPSVSMLQIKLIFASSSYRHVELGFCMLRD